MFSKYMQHTFTCHFQFMFLHGVRSISSHLGIFHSFGSFHPNLMDTKHPLEKRFKLIHMLFQRQIITKYQIAITSNSPLKEPWLFIWKIEWNIFKVKYLHMLCSFIRTCGSFSSEGYWHKMSMRKENSSLCKQKASYPSSKGDNNKLHQTTGSYGPHLLFTSL